LRRAFLTGRYLSCRSRFRAKIPLARHGFPLLADMLRRTIRFFSERGLIERQKSAGNPRSFRRRKYVAAPCPGKFQGTTAAAQTLDAFNRNLAAIGKPTATTTHFSVVDAAGMPSPIAYTLNNLYGRRAVRQIRMALPETLKWNDFTAQPGNARILYGSSNPRQTRCGQDKAPASVPMMPTILLRDGQLSFVTRRARRARASSPARCLTNSQLDAARRRTAQGRQSTPALSQTMAA